MNKDVQKKKQFYPISGRLRNYLSQYKREISLAVQYENLLQSVDAYPLMNEKKMRIHFGKAWFTTSTTGKRFSRG